MAKPVGFRESNKVLGKPDSMSDAECGQLPTWTDGQQSISCWKLTPEEIEEVNRTGCVYVGILSGSTQPPCWIQGVNPFKMPVE